ncbi:leptin receptor gene-related protein-like [Tubulanus polymorphus]|uniref:leptin receptor gene-related protein-like n=1 Tax=Tubulanus polymorphus TaxID=672921 RepID=UPI003DA610CA
MAGIRVCDCLVALAFSAAIGITLLVLGCALPQYQNWWPMFVILFYALAPIPTMVSKRFSADSGSSALIEAMLFLTAGIVVSAYGLPVVLAHTPLVKPVIQWGACALVMAGNTVVFLTILGYFWTFAEDDFDYSMW